VCGVTNRSYTYEEMYKKSRILAANIRKKFKIRDGDVVGLLSQNVPEYPIVSFAVLMAGGVITTLNPVYTACNVFNH
jgi:4-coumarate--CoA ligase